MTKRIHILIFCFLAFGLMSCSGSGQLADGGGKRTYNKNIQTINNYFLQISRNSAYSVDILQNDAQKKAYTISRRQSTGRDITRTSVGHVYITFVNENKTSVAIENPDYPFSYPPYKKVDYQRIIFTRLEEMLQQK